MNNFKNLKELYQALLDGKTICHPDGTIAKMMDDDCLLVKTENGVTSGMILGQMHIESASSWSIYQEPEKWYKVIALKKYLERPFIYGNLYKSEEDFLKFNSAKKEDYHWIILEEVKL